MPSRPFGRGQAMTRKPDRKIDFDLLNGFLDGALDHARRTSRIDIGDIIPGEGVYLGIWQPKDKSGKSLGATFKVFAAPEDLRDAEGRECVFKYEEAVTRISELKNWHGHDGANYKNDVALYDAIKNLNYYGGWFIPPAELLTGMPEFLSKKTRADNLVTYRNSGAFKGSFNENAVDIFKYPAQYWSSTEMDFRSYKDIVSVADIMQGKEDWRGKNPWELSCRPVRLVRTKSI